MKQKIGVILAMVLLFATVVPGLVSASSSWPLRVEVNGVRVQFPDEQPYVDKAQRVQVPVRFVSEALGAKVDWTAATKTVSVELDFNKLKLVLGQKTYKVNGENKQMDTAATRVGGRTFVPLRFVSEGLGASVKWDSAVRTVYISTSGFVEDNQKPEQQDKQDEVTVETIHGFKVKRNTGSQLHVLKGGGGEEEALMLLGILFTRKGADYEMQVQEVQEILAQRVEKDTVEKVIQYVRTKTTRAPALKQKIFEDKQYKIWVESSINGSIEVMVFEK